MCDSDWSSDVCSSDLIEGCFCSDTSLQTLASSTKQSNSTTARHNSSPSPNRSPCGCLAASDLIHENNQSHTEQLFAPQKHPNRSPCGCLAASTLCSLATRTNRIILSHDLHHCQTPTGLRVVAWQRRLCVPYTQGQSLT